MCDYLTPTNEGTCCTNRSSAVAGLRRRPLTVYLFIAMLAFMLGVAESAQPPLPRVHEQRNRAGAHWVFLAANTTSETPSPTSAMPTPTIIVTPSPAPPEGHPNATFCFSVRAPTSTTDEHLKTNVAKYLSVPETHVVVSTHEIVAAMSVICLNVVYPLDAIYRTRPALAFEKLSENRAALQHDVGVSAIQQVTSAQSSVAPLATPPTAIDDANSTKKKEIAFFSTVVAVFVILNMFIVAGLMYGVYKRRTKQKNADVEDRALTEELVSLEDALDDGRAEAQQHSTEVLALSDELRSLQQQLLSVEAQNHDVANAVSEYHIVSINSAQHTESVMRKKRQQQAQVMGHVDRLEAQQRAILKELKTLKGLKGY
eukprot:PhM_4_TR942/c0_g1_i1/m.39591